MQIQCCLGLVFLDMKCNLDMKTVEAIQLRTLDDHVAIMFTTSDGLVSSPMPCWIDEEYTTVRVHDLPPEMPSKDIWSDMAKYGNVMQIYHEYWRTLFPNVKNGSELSKTSKNPSSHILSLEVTKRDVPTRGKRQRVNIAINPCNQPLVMAHV